MQLYKYNVSILLKSLFKILTLIPTDESKNCKYRNDIHLQHIQKIDKYVCKICEIIKTKCDQLIFDIARNVYVEPYTQEVRYELKDLKLKYIRQNDDYMSYLMRQNTVDSKNLSEDITVKTYSKTSQ